MDSEHWQQNYYDIKFTEAEHLQLAARLEQTTNKWVATLGDHYRVWEIYSWARISPIAPRLLRVESGSTSYG